MMKPLSTSLLALALLAGPVMAQTACDPAQLAGAVDRYAAEPFSARTWRVLQGLGDPMIEPASVGGDTWALQERWVLRSRLWDRGSRVPRPRLPVRR